MPGQPLLVELDHSLGTLDIGLLGRHEVGLVGALPLDQEHEVAGRIGGTDDPFGLKVSVEASGPVVIGLALLLRLVRGHVLLPLAALGLLLLRLGLELLDQLVALQVLDGLPGIVFVAVSLPFEEVFDLSGLGDALVDNPLDDVRLLLRLDFRRMILGHLGDVLVFR